MQNNTQEKENALNTDTQKLLLRSLVGNVYDAQSVRIAMGNRLVASLRDMGVIPNAPEKPTKTKSKNKNATADERADEDNAASSKEEEEKENNKILVQVLNEFKLVSDVYANKFNNKGSIVKALVAEDVDHVFIRTELTYSMVESFTQMSKTEKRMIDICSREMKKHPLWDAFFEDVKGCGPLMAAVCVAYLDPYKARWPSSFYKYCGLDVVVDEQGTHGRSRRDAYMAPYIDRDGNETEKRTLGYNPVVKAKLVGVLGTSFLRAGANGKYAKIYYDYKNRIQNRGDTQDLRAVVIHRRAVRYAVKMFLKDLWYAWRTLEGLPTGDDYAVAKLGMAPHHDPRDEVSADDVLETALGVAL